MKEKIEDKFNGMKIAAISKEDEGLKTVELAVEDGAVKLLNCREEQGGFERWQGDSEYAVLTGFESSRAAFYRLMVPAVDSDELANIVRLQAESKFPLPGDQIEMAWRADEVSGGQREVTVVAARKDILEKYVAKVEGLKPRQIVLDSEAIVRVWKKLFSGVASNAIVVSVNARSCQICLVKDGKLINAANLDTGLEDAEDTQLSGCFMQDLSSTLDLFDGEGWEIHLLSDGNEKLEEIASVLRDRGFNSRVSLPEKKPFGVVSKLSREEIYRYRVAIGVGLSGLGGGAKGLDIFENLYFPAGRKKKKGWLDSWKPAAAAAAVIVILTILGWFAIDFAGANAWEESPACADCKMLVSNQEVIKSIAGRRIDMLELLDKVNKAENNGIEINNFSFKQGQVITLQGQAPNPEQLTKFEKSLGTQQGISKVKLQNPKKDEKSGKVNFSMTFHYKTFSSKKGLL